MTSAGNGGIINTSKVTTRPQRLAMIKRSNSLERAIFAEDTKENFFASCVAKVKPKEGFYDVALHGTPTSAEFFGETIDAYTLASIIKSRPDYKLGTPIRLLSCSTGNTDNTGDCFAQLLANELRTTVEAPTETLWVNFDGTFYVGKNGIGQMKLFYSRV